MPAGRSNHSLRPRLILADDHQLFLDGLTRCLEKAFEVVATARTGAELLPVVKRTLADGLLLDIQLPGKNGLDLIPCVLDLQPALKILVVTMAADPLAAEVGLNAGASGFVLKDQPFSELIVALGEVLAGRRYVSPRLPRTSHKVGLEAEHLFLQRLTPRQQQIFLMVGEGKIASEIAVSLHVCPSTISFHKENIRRILGFGTVGEFLKMAVLVRARLSPQPLPTH